MFIFGPGVLNFRRVLRTRARFGADLEVTATMNDSMTSSASKAHIRVAKLEEYGQIAVLARKAFIRDPLIHYIGSLQKLLPENAETEETKNVDTFFLFFLQACHCVGGRITVGIKNEPGATQEEIVCAAFWCPPNKRLALWKVPTLFRSGVLKVLKMWGLTALKRMGEYSDPSHAAQEESFRAKGLKISPDSAWYLQLIYTDPAHQGQGFMSALMQEAYHNAPPDVPFTLEATSTDSRDRYIHLGFEMVKEFTLGKGRVDASGVVASGQEAAGFPVWTMINWNRGQ